LCPDNQSYTEREGGQRKSDTGVPQLIPIQQRTPANAQEVRKEKIMSVKNKNAAPRKSVGLLVQAKTAASSDEQPTAMLRGSTFEMASDSETKNLETATSQPVAAEQTQVELGHSSDAEIETFPPLGPIVPSSFVFSETDYEPRVDVTEDEVANLSDNDLLTGLKKQQKRTQAELDAFIVFYNQAVARYSEVQLRTEGGQFRRSNRPTLPEAFAAIGLNYETERKRKQRYLAARNVRFGTQKTLQLTAGDIIQSKSSGLKGEVEKVHEKAPKADVVFEGAQKTVTVPIMALKKVTVRKVTCGDLLIDAVTGSEYRYDGAGKLFRTQKPDFLQQKRERDSDRIKAKQDREREQSEEKNREKEVRQEEAARRDLEKIAAIKAKKEAVTRKKEEAARRAREKKEAKAAAKAAKKNARPQGATGSADHGIDYHPVIVGDKSEPTPHGYFWEFRKDEKHPYVVRNVNHPNLGILVECPSKSVAEMKMHEYEHDDALVAA
jgi:hypothetical protein